MNKWLKLKIKKFLGIPDYSIPINYYLDIHGIQYKCNPQIDFCNIDNKTNRIAEGGDFEWKDVLAENIVIGKYFLKDVSSVINIGAGVGTFEANAAPLNPQIQFVASDYDAKSIKWCVENRSFSNVTYNSLTIRENLAKYGKFDLAVSIEVIEHLENYKAFLDDFSMLSSKAIIGTPNRERWFKREDIQSPPNLFHAQEFNSGELYFILKMYYKNVQLYSMPDPYGDIIEPIGLYSKLTPLIAYCEN